MQFIEDNEIWEWCKDRSVALSDHHQLLDDPSLSHRKRATYARDGRSGWESAVAGECIKALGRWDECLLWVRQWGIWGSSENWPVYCGLRGARGELRSLEKAPGHLFSRGEQEECLLFLTQIMENAWDADVIIVPKIKRIWISHDEWLELQSTTPTEFAPVAV